MATIVAKVSGDRFGALVIGGLAIVGLALDGLLTIEARVGDRTLGVGAFVGEEGMGALVGETESGICSGVVAGICSEVGVGIDDSEETVMGLTMGLGVSVEGLSEMGGDEIELGD
jgi:hypothetical protein